MSLSASATPRTLPPIARAFVVAGAVERDAAFPAPAVRVYLDRSDILTRVFFNKFRDMLAIRLLTAHVDGGGRRVWLPDPDTRMSLGLAGHDCDWPLLAALPGVEGREDPSLVVYGRARGGCTADELRLTCIEYKSKVALELYMRQTRWYADQRMLLPHRI